MKTLSRLLPLAMIASPAWGQSVLTYHNTFNRHGEYVVPGLTAAAAAGMHQDATFTGSFTGAVYAQPLYWKNAAQAGRVIVATETNQVRSLDAGTGATVWTQQLPAASPNSALQCGNINPEGITGTPVIDPATGTIFLDALTGQTSATVRHNIYALSADTGTILPGYPLDVQSALSAKGVSFDSTDQGERGALLFLAGSLYLTYGGRSGDCGGYHGTVVQVAPGSHPIVTAAWTTRAARGGIWAQGGAASDSAYIYVTTGNTDAPSTWMDGEAVVRLRSGLAHELSPANFFTPVNWHDLDLYDADLGGTEAIPLNAPGSAQRVIAFGKDGNAYLLNRKNLGGIGGAISVTHVSKSEIITAPAVYNTASAAMVVFRNGNGLKCGGSSLSMLNITTSSTPVSEVWCAPLNGAGSPIVTTSNGRADPLVWVLGAEGDNQLHGFNAMTGAAIFSGGNLQGLRHFETILAANNHLYFAGSGILYGFTAK